MSPLLLSSNDSDMSSSGYKKLVELRSGSWGFFLWGTAPALNAMSTPRILTITSEQEGKESSAVIGISSSLPSSTCSLGMPQWDASLLLIPFGKYGGYYLK